MAFGILLGRPIDSASFFSLSERPFPPFSKSSFNCLTSFSKSEIFFCKDNNVPHFFSSLFPVVASDCLRPVSDKNGSMEFVYFFVIKYSRMHLLISSSRFFINLKNNNFFYLFKNIIYYFLFNLYIYIYNFVIC